MEQIRLGLAPEVTPSLMIPVALCGIYEFIFDFGQHLSSYGTQNLHVIVCMCFPVGQGQYLRTSEVGGGLPQCVLARLRICFAEEQGRTREPHFECCWLVLGEVRLQEWEAQ